MSSNALEIHNLSKLYRLGQTGTGSLRQDINLLWHKLLGKKSNLSPEALKHEFWALQNIDLKIPAGESWGIVGANGAGKSTLLKVISRIVQPTTGYVKGRGTISSLLEIGTGFHGDLTGRENIYISGHILGMSKQDIAQRFDEIVDFSGIEKFIDTPVKRYSSGMYVRLAFAVAAHLEPDILVVDEVLAVGDTAFQQKCLHKMRQVGQQEGRTILFVSHNAQAVMSLCQKAAWLQEGKLHAYGEATKIVADYMATQQLHHTDNTWKAGSAPGNTQIQLLKAQLQATTLAPSVIDVNSAITVNFELNFSEFFEELSTGLVLYTLAGECIFELFDKPKNYAAGPAAGNCRIPGQLLNLGSYYFALAFKNKSGINFLQVDNILGFTIQAGDGSNAVYNPAHGYLRPNFPIKVEQQNQITL